MAEGKLIDLIVQVRIDVVSENLDLHRASNLPQVAPLPIENANEQTTCVLSSQKVRDCVLQA